MRIRLRVFAATLIAHLPSQDLARLEPRPPGPRPDSGRGKPQKSRLTSFSPPPVSAPLSERRPCALRVSAPPSGRRPCALRVSAPPSERRPCALHVSVPFSEREPDEPTVSAPLSERQPHAPPAPSPRRTRLPAFPFPAR